MWVTVPPATTTVSSRASTGPLFWPSGTTVTVAWELERPPRPSEIVYWKRSRSTSLAMCDLHGPAAVDDAEDAGVGVVEGDGVDEQDVAVGVRVVAQRVDDHGAVPAGAEDAVVGLGHGVAVLG